VKKGEGIVMQELEEAPLRGGPSFYWSVESTRAFREILIDRMIPRPILSWGIFLRLSYLSGQSLLCGLLGKSLIWEWISKKQYQRGRQELLFPWALATYFRSLVSRQLDGIFILRALKWKKPRLTKPMKRESGNVLKWDVKGESLTLHTLLES